MNNCGLAKSRLEGLWTLVSGLHARGQIGRNSRHKILQNGLAELSLKKASIHTNNTAKEICVLSADFLNRYYLRLALLFSAWDPGNNHAQNA